MIKSELAFIPNNLSSHSLQLNNFIQQQASEENSEQWSSPLSKKDEKQSEKNGSKSPSFIHNQSNSNHANKMEHQMQQFESNLQDKNSAIDTPVNLLNQPAGRFSFTPQAFPTQEQLLVEAITTQLNQMQMKDDKIYLSEIQMKKRKSAENAKKEQTVRQYQELKVVNPFQQVQTDFSELSRDIKIFEHRYESNLAVLSDQTKELLSYYQSIIQQEEQRQLRKQIMMLQIHNHRTKISLRNASYTKRFNYISPIPKNNDEPLEFKPKFKVQKHMVDKLEELCRRIKEEQTVWDQQEAKLTLLNKYYNIVKQKVIVNNIENQTDFKYDSKLERYTNRQASIKNSEIAIDASFAKTNGLNFSNANSIHGTNYSIKQSPIVKKGLPHPQVQISPKKKAEAEIVEPYQQYNLLKYKTQISKEIIVQYQFYNSGRLKRVRDQNRMIKKELEFIDQHIQHFEQSFAQEMKHYEQKAKPKINYQSFKTSQQETPYTRSPISRDYYGNSKGCNTINLYRPDSKDPTHIKSNPKSRPNINKSLSQSKYTIKREPTINMSNSKKDITLSQNFILTQNDKTSERSGTVVSFFRNKVASPPKSNRRDVCIYTSKKELASIKQVQPINVSSKKVSLTLSSNSLSPRSKNLLRFSSKSPTQQSLDIIPIKNPRVRFTGNTAKASQQQKRKNQSEYSLSLDAQLSNH